MLKLLVSILLPIVLAQSPQTLEEMLERLVQTAPSSVENVQPGHPDRRIPETSQLDRMYNRNVDRKNQMRVSPGLTRAQSDAAVKEFRKSSPAADDTEYLLKTCNKAFKKKPTDWDALRKCFFVAEAGYSDNRLISIATSVVSFEGVDNKDVSTDQIRTTVAALTILAHLDWPGRADLLKQCTQGTHWQNRDIRSTAMPDLLRLLQGHAIYMLAALPIDEAETIVKELEGKYPPSLYNARADDGPLALAVAISKVDIERRKQGLPEIIPGIR